MMTFSFGGPPPALSWQVVPSFATFWTIFSPDETVANGVYEAGRVPEGMLLYTMKNWLPLLVAVPLLAMATVPAVYVAPVRFSLAKS
jgi:hypothetical protein